MGFMKDDAKFLLVAKNDGVSFDRTLTLGRQNLYIDVDDLEEVLSDHFRDGVGDVSDAARRAHSAYIEPFLELLGASEVVSVDYSDYEGATVVHDLNQPVGLELRGRFDVVLDCGTLEHIFNFPVAIKNCMEMLKVSGCLIIHTPVNNQMGHGFYQFSPELFFRVLSEANGFQVERLILFEESPGQWYEVADPESVRARIELRTCLPAHMLLRARKTRAVPPFGVFPQQSDYVNLWQSAPKVTPPPPFQWSPRERAKTRLRKLMNRFAPDLTGRLRAYLYRRSVLGNDSTSLRNRRFYRPVSR